MTINGHLFVIKNLDPESSPKDSVYYLRLDQFGRSSAEPYVLKGLATFNEADKTFSVGDIITINNDGTDGRKAVIVALSYDKNFPGVVYRYLDETSLFNYKHTNVLGISLIEEYGPVE